MQSFEFPYPTLLRLDRFVLGLGSFILGFPTIAPYNLSLGKHSESEVLVINGGLLHAKRVPTWGRCFTCPVNAPNTSISMLL